MTTQLARTQRKTKTGRVVSDKMDKTIVVSVERLSRHPIYKRVIRLTNRFKAHDELNEARVGDTVLIVESRPLSATKRWRLVQILQRAGEGAGEPVVGEEVETSEVIHSAAHPGRVRDDEAADIADQGDEPAAAGDAAEPRAADESAAQPSEVRG